MAEEIVVKTKTISYGIGRAALLLGTSYPYLWKILKGKLSSPAMVLKIERFCPSLFDCACEIDAKKICEENRSKYYWNEEQKRFILNRKYDKRYTEF